MTSTDSEVRSLTRVAVYEREIGASLERVWENVLDWEHLPSLHHESFALIERVEAGSWGWRARISLPPADEGPQISVELRTDPENLRYVTATVEGPGAGSEIWTHLEPRGRDRTAIRVEFLLPGVAPGQGAKLGEAYTALYRRLWDQDEAMMQRREQMIALLSKPAERSPAPLDLGPLDDLRARLPLRVDFGGRPFRLIELDGELVVHSTICPHLFGPLEGDPVEGAQLECPWHAYRFNARTGLSCDGDTLRLSAAPRIEIDPASSRVRLHRL